MSYFTRELPPNSLEVKVVEMQTPSTMWLADVTNILMTQKYYDVEARLKQVIDGEGPQYFKRMFSVGDIVAVYDAVSGVWSRAKICDIYERLTKYIYSLFLVDRGYSISTDVHNIRELPADANLLQFRCYHAQLFGIFPLSPKYGVICPQNVALQLWSPVAVNEVQDLLDTCEASYFTTKVTRKIVYGEIHLKFSHGYLKLSNYLIENNFAYYNNTSFHLTMEKSPYMLSEENLNSEKHTETKSVLQNISGREKPYIDDRNSGNPSAEFQIPASEINPANKPRDAPCTSFRNSPTGASASQAPLTNLHFAGRGGRLELLKTVSSISKPGGICSKPANEHNFSTDDWDIQLVASETNPTNKPKPAEGSKSSAETSRTIKNETKSMELIRFCEEMYNRTASRNCLRNDPTVVSVSNSPPKNLLFAGRGRRLEMLKSISSNGKPVGLSNNTFSNVVSSNDDQLTLIKELTLNETEDQLQETRKKYENASTTCSETKLSLDTGNSCRDYPMDPKCSEQATQDKSLPESKPSIFCRQIKTVYIPAGAEMSMLCSRKRKDKRKNGNR